MSLDLPAGLMDFLVPTGIVALAEIGDKTQLLALVLATRFRKPLPIIAGILLATLLNHWATAALGQWTAHLFTPLTLNIIMTISFLGMALWTLVPDSLDDEEAGARRSYGPFLTTLVTFFLAEIGDKTQVATFMLPAQYDHLYWVIAGTTLGMLIANVPVVIAGHLAGEKLPLKLIRSITATLFAMMGLYSAYQVWNAL